MNFEERSITISIPEGILKRLFYLHFLFICINLMFKAQNKILSLLIQYFDINLFRMN